MKSYIILLLCVSFVSCERAASSKPETNTSHDKVIDSDVVESKVHDPFESWTKLEARVMERVSKGAPNYGKALVDEFYSMIEGPEKANPEQLARAISSMLSNSHDKLAQTIENSESGILRKKLVATAIGQYTPVEYDADGNLIQEEIRHDLKKIYDVLPESADRQHIANFYCAREYVTGDMEGLRQALKSLESDEERSTALNRVYIGRIHDEILSGKITDVEQSKLKEIFQENRTKIPNIK